MAKYQYPIFNKYQRSWLIEVLGYSKGYLCRVATGALPLKQDFINKCCRLLGASEEELFGPTAINPALTVNPFSLGPAIFEIYQAISDLRTRVSRLESKQ